MTVTPEQIIAADQAVYRGSTPVDDGGCERMLQIMVAPDVARALEEHVRAQAGNALIELVVLSTSGAAGAAPSASDGLHADYAQRLRESGWLARADVLAALGTDETYHAWVSYQPSIVSGQHSETDDAGDPRNVPCHVRRAGEGGTGHKPPFAQVPMTNDEHHRQHNAGELAVYIRWQRAQGIAPLSMRRDEAMRWFDQRLAETRTAWAEGRLCNALGAARLADVEPLTVVRWARESGVPVWDTSNEQGETYETA